MTTLIDIEELKTANELVTADGYTDALQRFAKQTRFAGSKR
jgi:hypothetical protein